MSHVYGHQYAHDYGHRYGHGAQVPEALGAIAWWEADSAYMTLDGSSKVLSWTDRIGGHVLSQAVSFRQPLFSVDHVLFDGADDALAGAILPALNAFPFTVYGKLRYVAAALSGFGTHFCASHASSALATARGYIQDTGLNWFAQAYNGSANATPSISGGATGADQWWYLEYVSTTSRALRAQGFAEARDDATNVVWTQAKNTLAFGALYQSGNVLQAFKGRMYGVVIFDRVLSAAEHAKMQVFLS